MTTEATRYFLDAFQGSGHAVVQCGGCNRVHFGNGDMADWEEGELEQLRLRAKEAPFVYVEHADDAVHAIDLGLGTPVVIDCPCEGPARYERWVWRMREHVIGYLTARIAAEKAERERDAASLISLATGRVREDGDA